MLVSTRSIVIKTTKFGDNSLVIKLFTRDQGVQSFIVKNALKKNSRFHASLFSPLSVLDVVYEDLNKDSLKYFKDVTPQNRSQVLFYDPIKNSILLFYNEIIYKLIVDYGQDTELFDFIESEIDSVYLNENSSLSNAPIIFLIRLCRILGFYPEDNYSEINIYFHLQESRFVNFFDESGLIMNKDESFILHNFLKEIDIQSMSGNVRNKILKNLITYFQVHNDHIKKIESADILSSVLR